MKFKQFYRTKCEWCGCPKGTTIRVHDWNDKFVQISIDGELVWIPISEFQKYFEEECK